MSDQMLFELVREADPLVVKAGEPPPALLARVLASPRHETKPRRVHRWPRLALVVAALALSALIASLAIAGTGWLTGAPAPPAVITDFQAYTPQLGFHPDPGRAVLVANDGQVKLYATTNREGTYCLDLVAPWKPATTLDGGTCVPKAIASGHFIAGIMGAGPLTAHGVTLVVGGRIADPQPQSVRFAGPEGKTVTVPVGSSGFFVAPLTTRRPCGGGDWSSTFTALDDNGNAVAQTSPIVLERLIGRGCLVSFLQK
jgi:hypothetical protein